VRIEASNGPYNSLATGGKLAYKAESVEHFGIVSGCVSDTASIIVARGLCFAATDPVVEIHSKPLKLHTEMQPFRRAEDSLGLDCGTRRSTGFSHRCAWPMAVREDYQATHQPASVSCRKGACPGSDFPYKRLAGPSYARENFHRSKQKRQWPLQTKRLCDVEPDSKLIRPPPVGPSTAITAFCLELRNAWMTHFSALKFVAFVRLRHSRMHKWAWHKGTEHFLCSTLHEP
jgi:hypothetical protein